MLERNGITPTLSEQLIERLFSRSMVSAERVEDLQGMTVKLMALDGNGITGGEYIGNVIETNGRNLVVQPTTRIEIDEGFYQHNVPLLSADPITARAYYISNDPYDCGWVDQNDSNVKLAVFRALPNRMRIYHDGIDEVRFDLVDPDFDKLLEQILKEFPAIRTQNDLAALTSYVHQLIPYRKYTDPREKGVFYKPKFGIELKEYGSVCRHKTAAAIATLELRGIHAVFIHNSGKGTVPHAYYAVYKGLEGQTQPIISDPTANVTGSQAEVLIELQQRGLSINSHLPENALPLKFEPVWDSFV